MLNISQFARQWGRGGTSKAAALVSLVSLVLMGLPAEASVPLTRADVEALRNRVELIRGRTARAARTSDVLAIGDVLRTAASAQADLRFNDGSLARVGEQATFQFVPNTRNFRLSNGTLLLLIPPGRGRTNIQTPSAITGIQGSALVVRYIPERDLTIVMALTNNPTGPMTVTTNSCSSGDEVWATDYSDITTYSDDGQTGVIAQTKSAPLTKGDSTCGTETEYPLYAGQVALIQANQVQVIEFDLPIFYLTSPLVEGLELNNPNVDSPLGPALEPVRQETLAAVQEQTPFTESVTLTPDVIGLEDGNIDEPAPEIDEPAPDPVVPDPVVPDPVVPDPVVPDPVVPDPVVPDPVVPDPVVPDPVVPDPVVPDPVVPDPVVPDPVVPDPVVPDPVVPDPVVPDPVVPDPVVPDPVVPDPVVPDPVVPDPVVPDPVVPDPVVPDPVVPDPVVPDPVVPDPVVPDPVVPDPVVPDPVVPDPVVPDPVVPDPVVPDPVVPDPVVPDPVVPDPVVPPDK